MSLLPEALDRECINLHKKPSIFKKERMETAISIPPNPRPGKYGMNQDAIEQKMLEESDNEYTKREIIVGVGEG